LSLHIEPGTTKRLCCSLVDNLWSRTLPLHAAPPARAPDLPRNATPGPCAAAAWTSCNVTPPSVPDSNLQHTPYSALGDMSQTAQTAGKALAGLGWAGR
jgi:hypothetical protein